MTSTPSPDELAREYEPLAYAMAARACRRHRLPFDVVFSDAMWGLAKAIRRCTPGRPLAPYASSVIAGEILHGIRDRVGQRSAHERGEALVESVPLDGDVRRRDVEPLEERYPQQLTSPDHAAMVADTVSLWAAVATLPAAEQEMIRLTYRTDLPQTQIAERMGVNQMAVSRGLARAYASLQRLLSPPAGDGGATPAG